MSEILEINRPENFNFNNSMLRRCIEDTTSRQQSWDNCFKCVNNLSKVIYENNS